MQALKRSEAEGRKRSERVKSINLKEYSLSPLTHLKEDKKAKYETNEGHGNFSSLVIIGKSLLLSHLTFVVVVVVLVILPPKTKQIGWMTNWQPSVHFATVHFQLPRGDIIAGQPDLFFSHLNMN